MEEISKDQYDEAARVVEAYHRAQAERVAAQRAAYAVPVTEMTNSPEYQAVYDRLSDMILNHEDDSYFGIPVSSLHTIMRNLATQVGVTIVRTPVEEGTSDGE